MSSIAAPYITASDDPRKARFVGDLAARYFLETWASQGRKPAFCRVRNVGADSASFIATQGGEQGQMVSIGIPEIGVIRGRITRTIGAICMIELKMCAASRDELMSRLSWMVRRKAYGLRERRTMGRFTVRDIASAVSVEDAAFEECRIVNASRTGVLIESDARVRMGDACRIGQLEGKVARLTDTGFAIQFAKPIKDSSLVPDLLSMDAPRSEPAKVFML